VALTLLKLVLLKLVMLLEEDDDVCAASVGAAHKGDCDEVVDDSVKQVTEALSKAGTCPAQTPYV